jgi:hypothetical protein
MSCLDDILCGKRVLIGVRDFDECAKPESGLFINDLPQITFKAAAKIANSDLQTAKETLRNCINVATKLVFDEFSQEAIIMNRWNDDASLIPQAQFNGKTRGITANKSGLLLRRYRSEISQFFIDSVFVKATATGAGKVYIVDGSKTEEFDVDTKADEEVEVVTNYRAKSEEIKILFDSDLFGTYDGPVNNTGRGKNSCYTCSGKSMDVFVAGWNGTAQDNNCYGIKVRGTVRCFEDNLLCGLISKMHTILWYRAGIEFLNAFINTDRINFLTAFGKEQAKENRKELKELYDARYEAFISNSQNYIRALKADCLKCNTNRHVSVIP